MERIPPQQGDPEPTHPAVTPDRKKQRNVVELRDHPRYTPDLRSLASRQVAASRAKLGLSRDEFASQLEKLLQWRPAADVVRHWEDDVAPPGDVLLAATLLLQDVPGDVLTFPLNPRAEPIAHFLAAIGPGMEQAQADNDVVACYPDRGRIGRQEWNAIIHNAGEVWLYGMAEFGYATDDDVPSILHDVTRRGGTVRVLLLDPDHQAAAEIDADEGNPSGTLAARIRAALQRFSDMRRLCGPRLQIRTYAAYPSASIVRGDHRMLVTPYLRFFIGSNSPTFELHAGTGKTFGRYRRHFDNTWALGKEWINEPDH